MRLTRIAARDFLAYEQLDIDLSDVQSVVIVGSNGHGKSGLFDVVRYTAFGKGRFKSAREGGSPDQQIRDGAEAMWTCVEFDTPTGQHVRVERSKERGKAADIHVWVDDEDITVGEVQPITGKATQHTNAETDADIARLIGLPYETISAGPWMAQKQASALMDSAASDRMRMFVKVFEAEWCAPIHEEAKRIAAEADASRAGAATQVEGLTQIVAREAQLLEARARGIAAMESIKASRTNTLDALTAVKVKIAEAKVRVDRHSALEATETNLRSNIKRSADEVARLQAHVDQAAQFLAQPQPMLPDVPRPDATGLAAAEAQMLDARAALSRVPMLEQAATAAEREARRVLAQQAIAAAVPCHAEGIFATCQFLTGLPSEEAIMATAAAFQEATVAAEEASLVAQQVPTLDATVSRIRAEEREADRQESAAREAMSAWQVKQASALNARDQHGMTIASLKDQLAADRGHLDTVLAEKASIEGDFAAIVADEAEEKVLTGALATIDEQQAQVEPALANVEGQLAMIAQTKAAIEDWRAKEAEARERADTYTILARAFHVTGIPTLIVENGLAQIEERANELLAQLPQDFRIELRTQREKKGGGLMDTLDIVVSTNGYERDYEMLSEGQQFRVDVTLRLAMGAVLAERGGIETLWLDEPLADLDEEGREAVIALIGTLAESFPLIVIVSHHPEFNDRFPATIEVVQDAGISEARLIA